MLVIGIEFITGVAVMTDVASREKAEWPPHPARIFMAMVAAHYECKPLPEDGVDAMNAWKLERTALEWLETQPAPQMRWPEVTLRDIVKVYVPVNDVDVPRNASKVKLSEMRAALGVLPDFRSRQERTFPSAYVGSGAPEDFVYLGWPEVDPSSEVRVSLEALLSKVTRIGHSSSLARAWLADPKDFPGFTYSPSSKAQGSPAKRLRIFTKGTLEDLDQSFNSEEIDSFFEFSTAISRETGRAKETAKGAFLQRFGEEWTRSSQAPARKRPTIAITEFYVRANSSSNELPIGVSLFDPDLLILSKIEGSALGLEATSVLTTALRGYLLKGSESMPEWFTGHATQGMHSTANAHIAILPLSYVGADYADGHVMGLAIAFPRCVPIVERAKCLRGKLFTPAGDNADIELLLGNLGTWTVRAEDRPSPPSALRSSTWTESSYIWASVTPVVLDRHPKKDFRDQREEWRREVCEIVAKSCETQGLPIPEAIDVDKTSWFRGAPRSNPGSRGMPMFPSRDGNANRQQVHILLKFPIEVQGPILLGAGRFKGYGLCKPLGQR